MFCLVVQNVSDCLSICSFISFFFPSSFLNGSVQFKQLLFLLLNLQNCCYTEIFLCMQSCLLDTMSFMDALPPFRMKQWQVIVLLFINALSVCRIPGLTAHLTNRRILIPKVWFFPIDLYSCPLIFGSFRNSETNWSGMDTISSSSQQL